MNNNYDHTQVYILISPVWGSLRLALIMQCKHPRRSRVQSCQRAEPMLRCIGNTCKRWQSDTGHNSCPRYRIHRNFRQENIFANFAHVCCWRKFFLRNFCPVINFSHWGVLTVTSCSFWRPLLARCRYYLIFKLHLGGTCSILQDRYHQSSAISEANAAVNRAAQRAKESKKRGYQAGWED